MFVVTGMPHGGCLRMMPTPCSRDSGLECADNKGQSGVVVEIADCTVMAGRNQASARQGRGRAFAGQRAEGYFQNEMDMVGHHHAVDEFDIGMTGGYRADMLGNQGAEGTREKFDVVNMAESLPHAVCADCDEIQACVVVVPRGTELVSVGHNNLMCIALYPAKNSKKPPPAQTEINKNSQSPGNRPRNAADKSHKINDLHPQARGGDLRAMYGRD